MDAIALLDDGAQRAQADAAQLHQARALLPRQRQQTLHNSQSLDDLPYSLRPCSIGLACRPALQRPHKGTLSEHVSLDNNALVSRPSRLAT